MAITIVERPQGYLLDYNAPAPVGSITNSGGDALFGVLAHGFGDGDVIYNISDVESYNGFWVVDMIDSDTFKIKDLVTGDTVPFVKVTIDFLYYPFIATTRSSCVHLPIVYKLENDLFPFAEPVNETLSFADTGGLVDITPTASLSASFIIGGYVRLEGTSVDGIYRIVDNSGSLVIDLPYDAGYTLAGGDMSVYYNNYHIRVNIYAGLHASHFWADKKPYELVSTLQLTPENDNSIRFSISNEVKKQIKSLTNNLTLDTLPNNIDFISMFYITTQEVYDTVEDGEVVVFEDVVSDPDVEGIAVNAKLPFKNIHSGVMSDYVVTNTNDEPGSKFLTLFETPTLFTGYPFDISALVVAESLTVNYMSLVTECLDAAGEVIDGQTIDLPEYSWGIYRFEIEPNCSCTQMRVYIIYQQDGPTPDLTERKLINVNCKCANQGIYLTWLNYLGGMEYWLFTAQSDNTVSIEGNTVRTKNLFHDWPKSYGQMANTIRQETKRTSRVRKVIRSQNVSQEDVEAIKHIKTSPLVQIVVDRNDTRTVIVDTDSFTVFKDGDKTFSITFAIEYTDEIPAQSL